MIEPTIPNLDDLGEILALAKARSDGRLAAEEIFEHLQFRMKNFQSALPAECELGVKLANFGIATEIHVRSIAYSNPNVIEFSGVLDNGNQVTLVQHVAQLNFLLIAIPPIKDEEPYRIGFRVAAE